MRCFNPIAAALLICATFNAHAADGSGNPCSLLDWQDFQSLGAVKETALTDAGWNLEKTPKEIPESMLFTDMCAVTISSKEGRTSITLSFDSFKGKATEQQVGAWLKSAAAIASEQPDVTIVKVGETTTCESGQYELPTKMENDEITNVIEHYIACDQQVGIQHVSLNVHVPEGKKASLPNPEQAKALLDKSVARMKKTSFGPPERKT